ncbi:MAG: NAD(P)-dependent oxidoreductase [Candidatus Magasanikbacteria bacterium]|jgi:CDP-paratose synthetase|nr:NAD(P)-dependent oxidoreductase [Candidatus Magasanikbacteria bacterium]MBT4314810.1 NAD(P)-dependent oxidoreductase [Candidatus Magasanikbacteria bacterium]MBT4547587.1 NAD(P)-dependent oxidoreductase [Candidatus Magasanikbacteria bacterium]MBT6818836.1 NAD(P)-dependent oxidoreductase [Candidatus Magasanikbacteria bacterium]
MEKDKKVILLTGATGYLGSSILKKLIYKGYSIIVLKRSFSNTFRIDEYIDKIKTYNTDETKLRKIFEENKIDIILHCATDYGRKGRDPIHTLEANLLLPLSLLELGRENGVTYFINTDTILDKRINNYSLSKRQFKDWLTSYKNDLVCINIALEHFYGPGDDSTKFVSNILRKLVEGVDNIDLTKGEQKRDFVFVDDVVNAFMTILENLDSFSSDFYYFEIGSNKAVTIRKLVEMMKELLPLNKTVLNFGALPYRKHEVMECIADTSAIKKFGWECGTSLEDGIKKTLDFELKSII